SLKTTLWQRVYEICQQEAEYLKVIPTHQFVSALTDLVYKQAETAAINLENFANHANRTTILMEDVKLLTRRNEDLNEMINNFAKCIDEKHGERIAAAKSISISENNDDTNT
ncbi:13469_t:CDS:2, partial [Racocetra persica]